MKTSYVHIQTPNGRSLGFSAKIVAHPQVFPTQHEDVRNSAGDLMCYISITFCNKADKHFNKALARAELELKPEMWVRCRDVPGMLQDAYLRASGKFLAPNFDYVLRRFL